MEVATRNTALQDAIKRMGLGDHDHTQYLRVQRGRRWDSCTYAYGSTITRQNSRMFNNVGVASGKNRALTNMNSPQRFDPPESMLVERILIAFAEESSAVAIRWFMEAAVFRFYLMSRWHVETPLIALPREDRSAQKAPLKCCLSCSSCFVGLKCPECGAPEWKYLEHAGDPVPETLAKDGVRLVIDAFATPIFIDHQMSFYGEFDVDHITLPFNPHPHEVSSYPVPFALRWWVILEGWEAKAIQ